VQGHATQYAAACRRRSMEVLVTIFPMSVACVRLSIEIKGGDDAQVIERRGDALAQPGLIGKEVARCCDVPRFCYLMGTAPRR
jgi:hypothetical protein